MNFIHHHLPGTQMTLILIGKGLLLEGSSPKIEDKQVRGIDWTPTNSGLCFFFRFSQLPPRSFSRSCFDSSVWRWTQPAQPVAPKPPPKSDSCSNNNDNNNKNHNSYYFNIWMVHSHEENHNSNFQWFVLMRVRLCLVICDIDMVNSKLYFFQDKCYSTRMSQEVSKRLVNGF